MAWSFKDDWVNRSKESREFVRCDGFLLDLAGGGLGAAFCGESAGRETDVAGFSGAPMESLGVDSGCLGSGDEGLIFGAGMRVSALAYRVSVAVAVEAG